MEGSPENRCRRMKRERKWFWGIWFILGAVVLIAGAMGCMKEFGFWTILLSIALVSWLIEGIYKRSFGAILFSIAIFVILNAKWLGLPKIPPVPVLLAAALAAIGLNILFPNVRRKRKGYTNFVINGNNEEYVRTGAEGQEIHCEAAFNSSVKYVNSSTLSCLYTECSFGSMKVYFDNEALKNGTATVYVENSFGSTIYYVPSSWRVVVNVNSAFGSCEEKGRCNPTGENTLYINGEVSFGSLVVQYV